MILVTGGSGFIGSHLLDKLSALQAPARALLRRKVSVPPAIDVAFGDLETGQGIEDALRGVTAIIHLAGITKALRPSHYYAGNTRATERLAGAAAGQGIRFVQVSSLAAIGPSLNGSPVSEDTSPHPITHYGKSKLEAERATRTQFPDGVMVRPPVVYGPRDRDVFQLLRSISKGIVVKIAGTERRFSCIYVDDLVEGLLLAAECRATAGHAYFLAHPKPATWTEFEAAAAGIMHRHPRVLRLPARAAYAIGACAELWSNVTRRPGILSREKVAEARCQSWVCDTRLAARELGFDTRMPLESGLARTLAWYKEAGWLSY